MRVIDFSMLSKAHSATTGRSRDRPVPPTGRCPPFTHPSASDLSGTGSAVTTRGGGCLSVPLRSPCERGPWPPSRGRCWRFGRQGRFGFSGIQTWKTRTSAPRSRKVRIGRPQAPLGVHLRNVDRTEDSRGRAGILLGRVFSGFLLRTAQGPWCGGFSRNLRTFRYFSALFRLFSETLIFPVKSGFPRAHFSKPNPTAFRTRTDPPRGRGGSQGARGASFIRTEKGGISREIPPPLTNLRDTGLFGRRNRKGFRGRAKPLCTEL